MTQPMTTQFKNRSWPILLLKALAALICPLAIIFFVSVVEPHYFKIGASEIAVRLYGNFLPGIVFTYIIVIIGAVLFSVGEAVRQKLSPNPVG